MTRSGGNKSQHAHKRRRHRGDNSRGSVARNNNAARNVGANRNGRSDLPHSNISINAVAKANRGNGSSVGELKPIKISSGGIMVSII